MGVIEPGARAAVACDQQRRHRCHRNRRHDRLGRLSPRALLAARPALTVIEQACPLFVPIVEEGWFDRPATRLIAEEYLAPVRARGVDVLVLGCTHYPLLKPLLSTVMGNEVQLIDSARETARDLAQVLAVRGHRRGRGNANSPLGRDG